MLSSFFLSGPYPADQLVGSYDIRLVVLSYLVAVGASYIALDITGRLRDIGNTPLITSLWIIGGAIAMGSGIWSMHFIGMLSFSIPNMSMYYDPFWTGLSLIVAVAASGFALSLLKRHHTDLNHLILGGIVLGIAIASMHYTGMHAMSITMKLKYLPSLFFLSIFIAIIASEAALWLAIKSNSVVSSMRIRLKMISALVMGAAICGMHYTGMAATVFIPSEFHIHGPSINVQILAISVATVTMIILGVAFFASTYKEALEQQMINTARQAGMAEVAASVLHNVGNVLNSVNVSANILSEKNAQSKLTNLSQLSKLFEEHKHNLAEYLTSNPKGSELPKYIKLLASYWESESSEMKNEINSLITNINHIRNIINTQQDLSRIKSIRQYNSVKNVIEESLLITGIEEVGRYGITVEKHYTHLKDIYFDKVKVLQIIINLLTNAKDALREENIIDKKIIIRTGLKNKNVFFIEITDTGIGISNEELSHIFSYGYTTKKQGHGFGLHSSAISAKDMGGSISVKTEGKNKGATFRLELPYKI